MLEVTKDIYGDMIITSNIRETDEEIYERKKLGEILRRKSRTKCRNNMIDPDSNQGIGYITEVLVAKFLGIKTCFDITDNFNHQSFDLYEHEDFNMINAKGSTLRYYKGNNFWWFATERNRTPDFFFCIGYDKRRRHVKRVYIIPNDNYVVNLTGLYMSLHGSEYKWFREDEKPWDELFHTLKLDNCPVLKSRHI